MPTPKKNLVILATGGTIASTSHSITGDVYGTADITIDTLLNLIPDVDSYANIKTEQLAQIDSSEVTCELWLTLAQRCHELLKGDSVDGIIITHGTDTIEETAFFLNLVVPTKKPIVLTGAMRPAQSLSADGVRNLLNAIVLASHPLSRAKGVLITLNDQIDSARHVTKTNVSSSDSFRSIELGLLGYISDMSAYFYNQPAHLHTYKSAFSIEDITTLPKVDIVYGYADNDPIVVDALVKNRAKGIISAGLGRGHQPPAMMEALIRARKAGVHIVKASRTNAGIILPNNKNTAHGFIAANNLNAQKARILLAVALTQTDDIETIQGYFFEH